MNIWTPEDYQLAASVRADVTAEAALAVEYGLDAAHRRQILNRFAHTNLAGAQVADVLDILDDHDWGLEFLEPFYADGGPAAVRRALGWPAEDADPAGDPAIRPTEEALRAPMLRGRLIGFAALAVAALTDAIPAAGAVATLVDAAASRAGAVGA